VTRLPLNATAKPHPLRCQCGKVAGVNQKDAKRLRRYFAKRSGDTNQVRYYQCEHNGWHWTQQLSKENA